MSVGFYARAHVQRLKCEGSGVRARVRGLVCEGLCARACVRGLVCEGLCAWARVHGLMCEGSCARAPVQGLSGTFMGDHLCEKSYKLIHFQIVMLKVKKKQIPIFSIFVQGIYLTSSILSIPAFKA